MSFLHLVPYATSGHLADSCNEMVRTLPGEWFLFTDADVMFLTPNYGHLIQRAIDENPEAGLMTCLTNRIGATQQRTERGLMTTDSLLELRRLALERATIHGASVTPIRAPISGFFLLFRREAWAHVGGFKGRGILHIDWRFSRDIEAAKFPILRLEGLMVAHFYRLDGSAASGYL